MHVAFDFDPARLVSTIGFALRHNPAHFGLDLDEGGWASLEDLVVAIRFDRYDWALIDEPLLKAAVGGSDRFEIRDGWIRATYGHSIALDDLPPIALPPPLLFHGTTEEAVPAILLEGLKPMGRQFVHPTSDRDYALDVANAKQGTIALIAVDAVAARLAGHVFRCTNSHVWLTNLINSALLTHEAIQ